GLEPPTFSSVVRCSIHYATGAGVDRGPLYCLAVPLTNQGRVEGTDCGADRTTPPRGRPAVHRRASPPVPRSSPWPDVGWGAGSQSWGHDITNSSFGTPAGENLRQCRCPHHRPGWG